MGSGRRIQAEIPGQMSEPLSLDPRPRFIHLEKLEVPHPYPQLRRPCPLSATTFSLLQTPLHWLQEIVKIREEAPSGRFQGGFNPSPSDRSLDNEELSSSSPAHSSASQAGGGGEGTGVHHRGSVHNRHAWDPHESSLSSNRSGSLPPPATVRFASNQEP